MLTGSGAAVSLGEMPVGPVAPRVSRGFGLCLS